MRGGLLLSLMCGAAFATAQTLGTKPEAITQPAAGSPVGPGNLIQMLIAVAIVVAGLKWLLPKALNRVQRRIQPHAGSSLLVEETAAIGAGALWVVQVRGRTLLLGSTASGVNCLADLTENQPPEPVFLDAMDEALAQPMATLSGQGLDSERVREALRRLERLATER